MGVGDDPGGAQDVEDGRAFHRAAARYGEESRLVGGAGPPGALRGVQDGGEGGAIELVAKLATPGGSLTDDARAWNLKPGRGGLTRRAAETRSTFTGSAPGVTASD